MATRTGARRASLRARGTRTLCAAVAWASLAVAASTRLFEPLPNLPYGAPLVLAVAATIGAGLISGSRAIVALAVVPLLCSPSGGASPSDLEPAFPLIAAVAALLLLAAGVAGSRFTPRRVSIVLGALALAAPVAVTVWAAERAIWPLDARPAHPLAVSLSTGTFRGISLGEPSADARRALPAGTPATGFPVGVTFYPGDATRSGAHGVSLLTEHGHVITLFITDPRAETLAGVGVGDNLAIARDRLRGLVCRRSSEDVPTCAGRAAHLSVLFVGDPIESITLSSVDTGWCLVSSPSCPHPRPVERVSAR